MSDTILQSTVDDLLKDARLLIIERDPERSIEYEERLVSKVLHLISSTENDELQIDDQRGLHYESTNAFSDNERRYARFLKILWHINSDDVPPDEIVRQEALLSRIFDEERKHPMWYELTDDEVFDSKIRPFRLASVDYRLERLEAAYNYDRNNKEKKGKHMDIFENLDRTRDLKIRSDANPDGFTTTTLDRFIKERFRYEQDPNYNMHPYTSLMILTLCFKVMYPTKSYIGVKYLEMLTVASSSTIIQTLPFAYNSEGKFLGLELHSQHNEKFRMIINVLTSLVYSPELTQNYTIEYQEVSEELICFLLNNLNDGAKLKKAFSPINLYYGLRPGKSMHSELHQHPTYTMGGSIGPPGDGGKCAFTTHTTCNDCKTTNNDREIFKTIINPMLKEAYEGLKDLKLPKLLQFSKERLEYMCPNKRIIYDLMMVKVFVNAGGYSRSNQGKDFLSLQDMLDRNEDFRKSGAFKMSQNNLGEQMFQFGYKVAKRNLLEGQYPNAQTFQRNIGKWLTSRSAGRTSIAVTATVNSVDIKQSSTSKKAYAMMEGDRVLDLSTVKVPSITFQEYFSKLDEITLERLRKGDKAAIAEMLTKTGTFKIGSRAVVAYRPIRPIYLVVLALHLAFASTVGPIVDEISRSERYDATGRKRKYLIGEDTYNGVIATQHMDGSLDVVAPAVMASATSNTLALMSDSSNFDQTSINETSNMFLRGVQRAMIDIGINVDEKYMYYENEGKNLIEIMDILIEAITRRHYYVEYLGQTLQYDIDYLSSGRLDTFYMNSVKNALMHKNFIEKILSKYKPMLDLEWMQVAGDDGVIIFKTLGSMNGDTLKEVQKIVVDEFTRNNHIINEKKTLISSRSGEYAKLYWYFGMVFRDPSVQLLESEKRSNAETKIELVRGLSQKAIEYTKRSVGEIFQNMKINRMLVYLMCGMRIKVKSESAHTVLKWYPPYVMTVMPTSISGGLGMPLIGINQNDILMIRKHLKQKVVKAVRIISLIKFTDIDDLQSAIIRNVVSDYKLPQQVRTNLARGFKQIGNVSNLKYSAVDTPDTNLNFKNGLDYMNSKKDMVRETKSKEATVRLKGQGISIQPIHLYEYQPYVEFKEALKSFKHDKVLDYKEIEKLILQSKSHTHSEGGSFEQISNGFDIEMAFDFEPIFGNVADDNNIDRYVSYPLEIQSAERFFGARNGKPSKNRLKGSNSLISQFILRNSLPYTEDALYKIIIDYIGESQTKGMSDNQKVNMIKDILEAISGDYNSSNAVAREMLVEMEHWSDMHVNVATAGSILEPLDLSDSNIMKYVTLHSSVKMTNNLSRLVRFIGFKHLLNLRILNPKIRGLTVTSNDKVIPLLEKFTLLGNKNVLYRQVWNSISQKFSLGGITNDNPSALLDDNIVGSSFD